MFHLFTYIQILEREPELKQERREPKQITGIVMVICFGSRFNLVLGTYILLLLVFLPITFYCVM